MNTMQFRRLAGGAILTAMMLACGNAGAAAITFNPAVTISATTDVSTAGTAGYAYCWTLGNKTVNGVTFLGTNATDSVGGNLSLTGLGTFNGSAFSIATAPFGSLPASYRGVLTGSVFGVVNTTGTVTMLNLTSGRQYVVQAWVNDPRTGSTTGRTETVTSAGGNSQVLKFNSSAAGGSPGQFANGFFTADATSQALSIIGVGALVGSTNLPQLNAIQLRDVTGVAPYWTGMVNGNLDNSTANFSGSQSLAQIKSLYSTVYFSDMDGTTNTVMSTNLVVQSGGVAIPSMVFQNTNAAYVIGSVDGNGISGASAVTLQGPGAVVFNGMNSYTGATTINAGSTLQIGPAGVLGSTAIADSGTFVYGGAGQTLSGVLSGAGLLRVTNGGTLALTGTNTFTGGGSIDGGTLQLGGTGTLGNGAYAGSITNNGGFAFASSSNLTMSGYMSGTGSLTVAGSGTLTLTTRTRSYSGGTVVHGGVLVLGYSAANNQGTIGGPLTINTGATVRTTVDKAIGFPASSSGNVTVVTINAGLLDITGTGSQGAGQTVFMTAGEIRSNGGTPSTTSACYRVGSGTNPTLYTLASASNATISGRIALDARGVFDVQDGAAVTDLLVSAAITEGIGAGTPTNNIVKAGAGTMALTATSPFHGTTTISNGTLLVNGSLLSNGVVTVVTGATLGGTGFINGIVTNNGTVAPGSGGAGLLTLGNKFVQTATGTLAIEIGGTTAGSGYDQLKVGTAAELDGTLAVSVINSFIPNGYSFTVLQATNVSGTFAATNLPPLPGSFAWSVLYSTTSVVVSAVNTGGNSVVWMPTISGDWDLATTNWLNTNTVTATVFSPGDAVLFDDTGAYSNSVNLTTALTPQNVTVNSSSNYTFSGSGFFAGTMALTKDGTGTLAVTSTGNIYSGGTLISNGTLQLGTGGVCGVLGSGTITDNGILAFNNGDTNTTANVITGSGALVKAGTGPLTISGNNSYSGPTTVSSGTLSFNSIANVGAGNSALGAPTTAEDGTINLASILLYTGPASASDRIINNKGASTINNSGSGTLTLNGGITNAGSLLFRGASNITENGAITISGTLSKTDGSTLTLTNAANSFGNVTISKGTVSISSIANAGMNSALGAGSIITLGQSGFNNTGMLQFTGPGGGSSDRAISILSNTNNTNGGIIENTVVGQTLTLGGDVTTGGTGPAPTLQLIGAGNGVMSGNIAGPGLSLTKAGTGTWTLSGTNNTYQGPTSINAGTLALSGSDNVLPTNTALSFAGSGTLNIGPNRQALSDLNVSNGFTGKVTGGGGSLKLNGGNNFAVGGTSHSTAQSLDLRGLGSLVFSNAGSFFLVGGQGGGNSTETGTLYLPDDTTIVASQFNVASVDTAGANVRNNSGTLFMGTTNVINAGTVQIGIVNNSGVVKFNVGVTNPTLTIRGTAGGTSRVTTMTLGRHNSAWAQNSVGTLDMVTGVIGTGTLDALISTFYMGQYDVRNDNAGNCTATLTMTKGILDATTLYLGYRTLGGGGNDAATLTVDGGALKIQTLAIGYNSGGGALVVSLSLNGGATLGARTINNGTGSSTRNFNWNNGTLHNYDASTDLVVSNLTLNLAPTGDHFVNVDASRQARFYGLLTNSGNLIKTGDGVLTLYSNNTFSGDTIISNGTLALSGVGAIYASPNIRLAGATLDATARADQSFTIGSGQSFLGNGLISGNVTNNSTMTVDGSLLVNGGFAQAGLLYLNIASTSDYSSVNILGTADLPGALLVTTAGYTPVVGNTFTVLTAFALSGTFGSTNLADLGGGMGWSVAYDSSSVILSVTGAVSATGYDLWALAITNGVTNYNDSATGDGYPNLLKYATGSSPTNSDTLASMNAARTNGLLSLLFNRNTNALDTTLIVEGSYATTDDATWIGIATNIAGSWGASPTAIEAGTNNPVSVSVQDTALAATNRFLRLRVTRP